MNEEWGKGNCLGHPANFLNAENTLMVFSIIKSSKIFSFLQHHFFPQNFHNLVYVASVKGGLEAYLFSSGVHALVRSVRWILVSFRWRRRRGTWSTYGLVIRMTHTDWQSVWPYGSAIHMTYMDCWSIWVIRNFFYF